MQHLEVSCAVRCIYKLLGLKGFSGKWKHFCSVIVKQLLTSVQLITQTAIPHPLDFTPNNAR